MASFTISAQAAPARAAARSAAVGSRASLNTGMRSAFAGNVKAFAPTFSAGNASRMVTCMASSIQFIKGVDETCVPDVKLTRAKDGSSGTATFMFEEPDVFDSSGGEMGEITGLYMVDDEGQLSTVDVNARFLNGKPAGIEAKYVMRSAFEWDRFMRFMERYAEDNELGFNKAGK